MDLWKRRKIYIFLGLVFHKIFSFFTAQIYHKGRLVKSVKPINKLVTFGTYEKGAKISLSKDLATFLRLLKSRGLFFNPLSLGLLNHNYSAAYKIRIKHYSHCFEKNLQCIPNLITLFWEKCDKSFWIVSTLHEHLVVTACIFVSIRKY